MYVTIYALKKNSITNNLICFFFFSSSCLSHQNLYGKRSEICTNKLPQPRAVVRSAAILNTKNAWVVYLVVAVFVTMIATAAITSAIFCFCCPGAIGKERSVSPS